MATMTEVEQASVPIGAVSRITGLSGHTLRKWETRYQAVVPQRTESGRRLYSQQQIQRLLLLKELSAQGFPIGQVGRLSDAELQALRAEQPVAAVEEQFDRVTVVGATLTSLVRAEGLDEEFECHPEPAAHWLETAEPAAAEGSHAVILEMPTIQQPAAPAITGLRRRGIGRVVVVYGFAARSTLRQLLDGGVLCLKAPVSAAELLRHLKQPSDTRSVLAVLEGEPLPAHRFSAESIARLAALSPKLQCECPNHIAQLLLDIGAFEQYSLECEDSDPQERNLHARLRLIAANARALFEEAMAIVAANEGLELDELSPERR